MRAAWYTPSVRRSAALLATLALALAPAAGCGGNGVDGDDPTAGLTAPQIAERARAAARDASSFGSTIEATVAGTSRPGATPSALEGLITQKVSVAVTGSARRPHAMSMDTEIAARALPLTVTLIQVDDGLYLDVAGQGFRLATPPGSVASIEPANMPMALLDWMSAPQRAGRETVDGVPTVHLRGTLGPQSLTDLGGLVSVLAGRRAPRAASTARIEKGEIETWVGTGDFLPRRVRFSLRAGGKLQGLTNLSALTLDATLTFSGYGKPVDIVAPTNAPELRLDDLSSLLGG